MGNKHPAIGIAILAGLVVLLALRYAGSKRLRPFPWSGWAGAGIILAAEALLGLRVRWVTIYFTPLVWTGYLVLADSLVFSLKGSSLVRRDAGGFFALAAWSVPLWLIFEGYNLRLNNWAYAGMPPSLLAQATGCIWSFATIWPAIFETAELVDALGFFRSRHKPRGPVSRGVKIALVIAGALCLIVPPALPPRTGSYLFGIVWIGFALLLEPINDALGGRSLLREWEHGDATTLKSLLLAGLICGFLWEFWNYWAAARWVYIFPILQRWKIFEMPAPGFLGFLPFAVECFAMYEFLLVVRARIAQRTEAPASARSG
ncbi:MAG: hypothetical protein ACRD1N_00425 [Terriglobia bacterium]